MDALGLDISKRSFNAALLAGGKMRNRKFPNTAGGYQALSAWLESYGTQKLHACMESTGRLGESLALYLHGRGHTVSIVNPIRIKSFGKSELLRTKTDKVDAALIARFCDSQRPPAWQPLAPNLRQLQHFVRRLESLEQMRTSELNRLAKISEEDETRAFIEEMIAHVERQMADIERRIRDLIDDDSDLRAKRQLLLSIPGIGERTVAALLGEIPNMNEFRSGKAVGAFAGLSPRQFQSGAYSGQTRLSKIGNVHVRRAMYMPALCAIRWNHILQAFAARLRARGKSPKAIVAAVMRRLLVIAYGVLKSGRQFDPRRIAA